jgi:hypothetical protein
VSHRCRSISVGALAPLARCTARAIFLSGSVRKSPSINCPGYGFHAVTPEYFADSEIKNPVGFGTNQTPAYSSQYRSSNLAPLRARTRARIRQDSTVRPIRPPGSIDNSCVGLVYGCVPRCGVSAKSELMFVSRLPCLAGNVVAQSNPRAGTKKGGSDCKVGAQSTGADSTP